jgi:membrane protease subunit HflK
MPQRIMQDILDRYQTGIQISRLTLQNAQPPEQVQAAFDDAVKAGQDLERQKNEGQAYANDVIPEGAGYRIPTARRVERLPRADHRDGAG